MISGFVICMSAWNRPLRSFFASRVARLYPAYWAAIVLVTVVFALPWVAQETVSGSDFLVNLTMLQQPLGADRVLGVCWTLWAELRFYALFALFVVLPGGGRRRTLLFCAVWTLAAALTDMADLGKEHFLQQLLMPQYAPFFIGGIGLYLVHRNRRDALAWGVAAAGWLLGQHYAVTGLWHAPDPRFFSYRSEGVIVAVVTAGFVLVALIAVGKAGLDELALADRGGRPHLPVLPGARAPGLGGDPSAAPDPGAAAARHPAGVGRADAGAGLAGPPAGGTPPDPDAAQGAQLRASFAAKPRKSTLAAEVAPAESRLRRRKAADSRAPLNMRVLRYRKLASCDSVPSSRNDSAG